MLLLLSVITLCLIAFLTTLFILSPGKIKPFVDKNGRLLAGSMSEKIFIKIGGVEQGMFIRGKDIKKRDKAQHDLGIGTMHNMRSIIKDVFLPVWTCKAYTIREKLNIWISKFSFLKKSGLRDEIIQSDITTKVPRLEIPVYFISGRYDLTVNKDLSKEYLEKIEAPVKGFYTFNESAHSPMFEEPQRLKEILIKDVLNSSTNLADN